LNSGPRLPDHEYILDRSGSEWTSLGGNTQNGLNVRRVEVGITVDTRWLGLGRVTTSYSNGSYKMDVEAADLGTGVLYTFSLQFPDPAL
jgi:hypothetical protein